jgi:hypothetical protein
MMSGPHVGRDGDRHRRAPKELCQQLDWECIHLDPFRCHPWYPRKADIGNRIDAVEANVKRLLNGASANTQLRRSCLEGGFAAVSAGDGFA